MANLRRPSSKERDIVGWFKPNGFCKKHPKHRQSPGVCSLCLKDKLSQLSRKKITTSATVGSSCSSSASSLSSYYSSSASSCASPMHPFSLSTKGKSGSSSSVSIFLLSSSKHDGLVKSRSMAVVPRRRRIKDGEEGGGVDDDHHHNKKSAKKSGFWFKLLHPKSKRSMKEKDTKLVHSRSVRETVTLAT